MPRRCEAIGVTFAAKRERQPLGGRILRRAFILDLPPIAFLLKVA